MIIGSLIGATISGLTGMFFYQRNEIKKLELQLLEANKANSDLRQKLSTGSNPIIQLSDLIQRGVVLDVSVIDRNDVYYHNGGQYR